VECKFITFQGSSSHLKTFNPLEGSSTNSHTDICMNIVWSFCNSRAWLRVNGPELVGQLVELVGQLGTPVSTYVCVYIYLLCFHSKSFFRVKILAQIRISWIKIEALRLLLYYFYSSQVVNECQLALNNFLCKGWV
jgi:hypothetical protein